MKKNLIKWQYLSVNRFSPHACLDKLRPGDRCYCCATRRFRWITSARL